MGLGGRDRFKELNGLTPHDAGRRAFWQGRPLWSNPGFGITADDWRTGWREGASELVARAHMPADTDVAALAFAQPPVVARLLDEHRPKDVPRRRKVMKARTHRYGAMRSPLRRARATA